MSQSRVEGLDVLIEEADIRRRGAEIGRRITGDYQGRKPHVVGVLKGAAIFHADLVRELKLPITADFLTVSSYGSSRKQVGPVRLAKDLDGAITGMDVILVEDVIDTGNTAALLLERLWERQPASLRLCALLSKRSCHQSTVEAHYVGFEISDSFVVGYGLDYNQMYRNLPYIGTI